MNTWHIIKHGEECECEECGYPLYTGNSAFYTEEYGHVYCCRTCAENADPCALYCGADRMPEECGQRTGTYPCPCK